LASFLRRSTDAGDLASTVRGSRATQGVSGNGQSIGQQIGSGAMAEQNRAGTEVVRRFGAGAPAWLDAPPGTPLGPMAPQSSIIPDSRLTSRELDELVDQVVERIEQRVVDELERRGRYRTPGGF
jgi:hypothetical protein